LWDEMIADSETIVVGGERVEVPGSAMRAMHVVLHARFHEAPESRASEDLRRAMKQVDRATWCDASNLARRLGVEGEMGSQLWKTAEGSVLASEVGLPGAGSLKSYIVDRIKNSELPTSTYVLWTLTSLATRRDKVRFIAQKQFPSQGFMKRRYAIASKGVVGLTASYAVRAAQSCSRLPGAWWNWVRFNGHLRRIPPIQRPSSK
jgi:hypothetical protein